jgi:hypothetical protein
MFILNGLGMSGDLGDLRFEVGGIWGREGKKRATVDSLEVRAGRRGREKGSVIFMGKHTASRVTFQEL